jgi:hypothetical protein
MPNAIVQIGKFVWVVTSCGGRPTADVFAYHYELHYQNKKIHLEGSKTTFIAQFGCITFHPSRFGNHARLTPATRKNGLAAGMVIGFTVRCLRCRQSILEAKGPIR